MSERALDCVLVAVTGVALHCRFLPGDAVQALAETLMAVEYLRQPEDEMPLVTVHPFREDRAHRLNNPETD